MIKFTQAPTGATSLPYLFNNLADLPVNLQQPARQALAPAVQIDSIFFVPAQTYLKGWFGWRYVPEQALVFTADGVLYVQNSVLADKMARTTYLRADELLYAQLSLLLLYGRLELAGRGHNGLIQVIIEFNTVGQSLLQPALHKLLRLAWGETSAPAPNKLVMVPISDQLKKLSMKFRNGLLHYGLQPGEQLLGVVFQPGIWIHRWHFLTQQILANTLLALTDSQLIIIEETDNDPLPNYGWIFTFCPRTKITGIEVTPAEPWQALQILIRRGEVGVERRITLEKEIAQAWQALWRRCNFANS